MSPFDQIVPAERFKIFDVARGQVAWWNVVDCSGAEDCPAPLHIEGCYASKVSGPHLKRSARLDLVERRGKETSLLVWCDGRFIWDTESISGHCENRCTAGALTYDVIVEEILPVVEWQGDNGYPTYACIEAAPGGRFIRWDDNEGCAFTEMPEDTKVGYWAVKLFIVRRHP